MIHGRGIRMNEPRALLGLRHRAGARWKPPTPPRNIKIIITIKKIIMIGDTYGAYRTGLLSHACCVAEVALLLLGNPPRR
jgi:hypothetical protein